MEPMMTGAAGMAAPPADLIKDSDQTKFAKDVLEASRTVPVIVDFWAPWCGPCKTLQPTIEKVVTEAKGKVKLVKINIDQNQMLAQQLRIQSIPAVYAFFGGRPVDGFMGAIPESQVKEFVGRLVQASGGFLRRGDTFAFVPQTMHVGSCPVERIPHAVEWVMSKVYAVQPIPADIAAADDFFNTPAGRKYARHGLLGLYTALGLKTPEPLPEFSA